MLPYGVCLPEPRERPNDGRTRAARPQLDRRAFLKTGALALPSVALWACERDLPLAPRGEGPGGEEPRFVFASGIENSYPLLPNGRRIDEMEKCDHYRRWREDFGLAQELGLGALRYGPAYYRTNPAPGRYDWSSVDDQLAWLRSAGITVIADLCHFGVPSWLAGFQDVAFPMQFAAYAREFSRRYPWVRYYTPINEIYVAATFSAWFGWWNEGLTTERAFATALRNLCLAHELAVLAILTERPDAIFVQAETIEHYEPADDSRDAARQAAFWNEARYTALDLTLGRPPSPVSLDLLRQEQWREKALLEQAGVPVKGFTWYPLTDVMDWRYALRVERNDIDPIGLCDLARAVRPVGRAYAALIAGADT